MLALSQFRVVLVETTHPGNIGGAARAMTNMGVAELVLVRPKDYPSMGATARAAGADEVLDNAQVFESLAEAVADCSLVLGTSARLRSIAWAQLHPSEIAAYAEQAGIGGTDSESETNHTSAEKIALVFGRERSGLTNEELDLCQALIHIPVDPAHTSLNLAAAVMVVLFALRSELEKQGSVSQAIQAVGNKHQSPPAVSAQSEVFFRQLDESLKRIDFYKGNAELVMRKLRKLIHKSQPSREELNILQGILTILNERLDELEQAETK